MNHSIESLALIPPVFLAAYYVSSAWNRTTLPILASTLLWNLWFGLPVRIGWSRRANPFADMHTRRDWLLWANWALWPRIAKLLTCDICQIPWITGALTLILGVIFGASPHQMLYAFCSSIGMMIYGLGRGQAPLESPMPPGAIIPSTPGPLAAPTTAKKISKPAQNRVKETASNYLEYSKMFDLKSEPDKPTQIPPRLAEVLPFFSGDACWFPGCEELREKLREEEAAAKAADCSTCDLGDITRKYQMLVREILDAVASPSTPSS